jgi:hypothetical protein
MLATQDRMIDGFKVQVSQLPARAGLKLLNRLGKVLGPSLGKAGGAFKGSDLKRLDLGALGVALGELFVNLSDEDLDYFIDKFFHAATLDNKPFLTSFDAVLQGRVETILKALSFWVLVHF